MEEHEVGVEICKRRTTVKVANSVGNFDRLDTFTAGGEYEQRGKSEPCVSARQNARRRRIG